MILPEASIKNKMTTPSRKIPSVKGLPVLGNTLAALKDPLKFLISLKKNCGDVVNVRVGTKEYSVIQSAEGCRHVLQENAKNYYKPGAAKMMKRFLGDGLATSNGELWLKQRRLIQPAFHRKKLEGLLNTITGETDALIQTWRNSQERVINMNQALLKLTLGNITKTMFGTDVRDNIDSIAFVVNKLLASASSSLTSLIKLPLSVPTPANVKFLNANREFEKIIYDIIERRKKENRETSSDLLDLLLHAYDDESKTFMTARQLRDEITTIFMAGHETTAQTLSWGFYQISLQPEVCRQISLEISSFGNDAYTLDSLQKMMYTKSVIEETMRMYPPVWLIARKAYHDDEICGHFLPAGSTVLLNVYGMNHYPLSWKEPGLFDPSRFDPVNRSQHHPFQFLPFGGGQRICIGNLFAMMVMQVVVGKLVTAFDFETPAGFRALPQPNVTLRARDGIRLIVKNRS